MRILLRVSVLVLVFFSGLIVRVSTLEPEAQALFGTATDYVGKTQNYQDLGECHAWSALDVLLVLDPNGMHCWEDVNIDNLTNITLLTWLHKQGDALSVAELPGSLLPLQLPLGIEGQTDALTFTELVEEAWQSQASTIRLPSQLLVAFQMTLLCTLHPDLSPPTSCLDSAQLKVTHVETFWKAVERTVAAGRLMPGHLQPPAEANSSVAALSNSVIILPRIVTRLHPVHQAPEEHIYSDLATWDVDFVIQMLQEFLRVSSAKTVPGLAEYRVLPDKVQLQSMYDSYYAADPSTRTPAIPTVNLHLSHAPQRESELCNGAEATDSERHAAKTALLNAVFELEKALAPEHPVRYMVDASGSSWMGRYIMKREYSEGAHHVFGLTLPELAPISMSADDVQSHNGSSAADTGSAALARRHADQPHASITQCSTDQAHTLGTLPLQLSLVMSHVEAAASRLIHLSLSIFHSASLRISAAVGPQAEAQLQPLGDRSADLGPTIHACINPDLAAHEATDLFTQTSGDDAAKDGSWVYAGLQLPANLDSLMVETADRLLHHSCGEGWLVQPRIANMSGLEYRVYLLGGGSAMNKGAEHSAVVYTPGELDEEGLHLFNITLPEGMFTSDVLPDPGETADEIETTSWRSYELWNVPEVYSIILKAAYDGAQAMMDSPKGHLMRMVSNVMVRVDVVLGAQWDPTGQIFLWPMINEMDWFNSAGMMTSFWKGRLPLGSANEGQNVSSGSEAPGQELSFGGQVEKGSSREARVIKEVQSSAGFKIAQALYMEILKT